MRRRSFVVASIGLAATTAGCTGGGGDDEQENLDLPEEESVEITDGSFDPLTVHVATGGTVTWENTSEETYELNWNQFHADSSSWSFNETLEAGQSVSHTFEEEGRYDYTNPAQGQFEMCGRVRVGGVDEGNSLPCE